MNFFSYVVLGGFSYAAAIRGGYLGALRSVTYCSVHRLASHSLLLAAGHDHNSWRDLRC